MAGDTKERILETALELFARNGYPGTSMSDIAERLGITKAALYKHYDGKRAILDRIIRRMNQLDYERAEEYGMPETEPDGFAEAYQHTPVEKIHAYSVAQFRHWTEEKFPDADCGAVPGPGDGAALSGLSGIGANRVYGGYFPADDGF